MDSEVIAKILNDPAKMQWLFLLMLWTIPWKGFALWYAAKNRQLPWFIAILILNTFGIIEIIYLAFFQKKSGEK